LTLGLGKKPKRTKKGEPGKGRGKRRERGGKRRGEKKREGE